MENVNGRPVGESEFQLLLEDLRAVRKEIDGLLTDSRSLERNVVVLVGLVWGFLIDKGDRLPNTLARTDACAESIIQDITR